MRRTLSWLLSASLVAGGAWFGQSFAVEAEHQREPVAAEREVQLEFPAAVKETEAPAVEKVTGPIGGATEAALTKGGFSDLVGYFVDQDRNRMREFAGGEFPDLDRRVQQINQVWRDKYDQEFSMDRARVFADARVIRGEIQDPVALLPHWPVNPTPGLDDAIPAAGREQVLTDEIRTQGNIDRGREVAIVHLPGLDNLPALNVSLIGEFFGWKIDVPNHRTGQQIQQDLLRHLNMLGDNPARWPDNVDEAYRLFSHHVMMAIYGIDLPEREG